MEDIIDIGFERILTSGQKSNAHDATDLISQLIEKAEDRIIIMPGSGIRSDNIIDIATKTKAVEFHTSARIMVDSKMEFMQDSLKEKLQSVIVDENEIRKIKSILNEL